ncbi:MAG: radical SAM protein [Nitrospirota bacterium]
MIILVNIASEFRGVEAIKRPPSGLLYVGGALKRAGFLVKVMHISAADIKKAVEEIVLMRPLFVGVSLFTGLVARHSATFSKELKRLAPNIPIVWGGVHPSLLPEQCLSQPYVDFVCIGEGEETIVELAAALDENLSLDNVKGIGFKRDGNIYITDTRPLIENLDAYEMDWSLLGIKNYVQKIEGFGEMFPYITSRGCPFSCGFCYNYTFNKRRWRAHSVEHVIEHIKKIKESAVASWVFFDDDNFFANKKRALDILYRLYDIGVYCSFLEIRVDSITKELMRELKDLKVQRIFIGWESGSDRMLKLVTKGFDKKKILEKCNILADYPEIAIDASAIIGFPTETMEDIGETLDLALRIAEIVPNNNFNIGTYLPYPGTQLYDIAIKEGFVPPKDPEGWGDFDILAGNIKMTWLPWASNNESEIFRRIDRYSKLLNHMRSPNPFINFLKIVLYMAARFRLSKRFMSLPIEVVSFEWWHKRAVKKITEKEK